MRTRAFFPLLAACCAAAAGCGESPAGSGGDPGGREPAVSQVQVSGPVEPLAVREAVQLTSAAKDAVGATIPGLPTAWAVSDTSVGRIGSDGMFTARAPGAVTVTATVSGISGALSLTVIALQRDTVTYGDDVPAQARTSVRALLSAVDSGGPTGVRVPLGSAAMPVYAVNAAGEAVLAGIPRAADSELALSARGTARTLVQTILLSPMSGGSAETVGTLDGIIEGHPRFAELVAAVRGQAAAGLSYLDSDAALALAANIAVDVGRAHLPAPATLRVQASLPRSLQVDADAVPVSVLDGQGTGYVIQNRAFFPFAATAYDERGSPIGAAVLPERELNLTDFPWKLGAPTMTAFPGRDGEVRLVIGQNAETRAHAVVKLVSDVIGGVHELLGLSVPPGLTSFAVQLVGSFTPQQVLAMADAPGKEAIYLVVNQMWGQKELVGGWIAANAGRGMARAYIEVAMKQMLGVFGKIEAAAFFAERSPFYVAWTAYAGKSDEVLVCQVRGVLAQCMSGRYSLQVYFSGFDGIRPFDCTFHATAEIELREGRLSGMTHGERQFGCLVIPRGGVPISFNPVGQALTGRLDGDRVQFDWACFGGVEGSRHVDGFDGVFPSWTMWKIRVEFRFTRTGDLPSARAERSTASTGPLHDPVDLCPDPLYPSGAPVSRQLFGPLVGTSP